MPPNEALVAEPDESLAVVRKPIVHDSARLHVSGAATYVDDIREPEGTLHVAVGLAPKARGRTQEPRSRSSAGSAWRGCVC